MAEVTITKGKYAGQFGQAVGFSPDGRSIIVRIVTGESVSINRHHAKVLR